MKKDPQPTIPQPPVVRAPSPGRDAKGMFQKGNQLARNHQGSKMAQYRRSIKEELLERLPRYIVLLDKVINKEITEDEVDKEALLFAIKIGIPLAKSESTYINLGNGQIQSPDDIVKAADEVLTAACQGDLSVEEADAALRTLFNRVKLIDVSEAAPIYEAIRTKTFSGSGKA